MSLKIAPIIFEATARINLKGLQASFGIFCKLLPLDELDALRKQWIGMPPTETDAGALPTMDDRKFIDQWLVGFCNDVLGADDQPLPFTPANVEDVLRQPGAKSAVIEAFFTGYDQAEAKNFETPLAGSSSHEAA